MMDVMGAVNGETSGGNVTLHRCKGGADLKTAGGSIEVENDGPVLAKTSGGSIRCQLQEVVSSQNLLLDLETTGGSINVSLVPDIAATVEARVLGGSVTTEFPVAAETTGTVKPDQLHGTINGGGSLLRLFSVGGNVILRKTEDTRQQRCNVLRYSPRRMPHVHIPLIHGDLAVPNLTPRIIIPESLELANFIHKKGLCMTTLAPLASKSLYILL